MGRMGRKGREKRMLTAKKALSSLPQSCERLTNLPQLVGQVANIITAAFPASDVLYKRSSECLHGGHLPYFYATNVLEGLR